MKAGGPGEAAGRDRPRGGDFFEKAGAAADLTAMHYALMLASDQLTRLGVMPAVAVWLPHVGVLALSAFILSVPSRPTPVPADSE